MACSGLGSSGCPAMPEALLRASYCVLGASWSGVRHRLSNRAVRTREESRTMPPGEDMAALVS